MREINEIIVHCTATRPEWRAGQRTSTKVREVKRWHVKDRGWSDIGYHYLIDRDGTVAAGRPVERSGAHTRGRNHNSVGVALFGGHGGTSHDRFVANFTPEQDKALRKLIADLRAKYPAIMVVSGHNAYAAKACPCFQVPEWLAKKPKSKAPNYMGAKPKPEQASTWAQFAAFFRGFRR